MAYVEHEVFLASRRQMMERKTMNLTTTTSFDFKDLDPTRNSESCPIRGCATPVSHS
jgi:hypothetical protein